MPWHVCLSSRMCGSAQRGSLAALSSDKSIFTVCVFLYDHRGSSGGVERCLLHQIISRIGSICPSGEANASSCKSGNTRAFFFEAALSRKRNHRIIVFGRNGRLHAWRGGRPTGGLAGKMAMAETRKAKILPLSWLAQTIINQ